MSKLPMFFQSCRLVNYRELKDLKMGKIKIMTSYKQVKILEKKSVYPCSWVSKDISAYFVERIKPESIDENSTYYVNI